MTSRQLLGLSLGAVLVASGLAACGGGSDTTTTTAPRNAAGAHESGQGGRGALLQAGAACGTEGALAVARNAVLACAKQGAGLVWVVGDNRTPSLASADPAPEPGALPDGEWSCLLFGGGDGDPFDLWIVTRGWTYALSQQPFDDRKPTRFSPYARGTQRVQPGSVAITFQPAGWRMLGEYDGRRLFLDPPPGTRAPVRGSCDKA